MPLRKRHVYQSWRSGTKLGQLPNVTSDFGYNQMINTPGAQLEIELDYDPSTERLAPDFLSTEDLDYIMTEDGDFIVTEQTELIYEPATESLTPKIGSSTLSLDVTNKPLIRNGNTIKVYEFSENYPNGTKVFEGYISKFSVSHTSRKIRITVLSFGVELDNYLIKDADVVDVAQTTGSSTTEACDPYPSAGTVNRIGQSFTTRASVNKLHSIIFKGYKTNASDTSVTALVSVYNSSSFDSGLLLGSANVVVTNSTAADIECVFSADIDVSELTAYYFELYVNSASGHGLTLYYNSGSDVYTGGTMYNNTTTGGGGAWTAVPTGAYAAGSDLYFLTTYAYPGTTITYSGVDQGNVIKSLVRSYIAQGGTMTLGTIDIPSTSYSYTFNTNTTLEGIKTEVDLAPYDYYWYGRVSDSTIHFRQTSTTATHKFIKGKHINDLDMQFTIEDLKNDVYFTGGDGGTGVNLYTHTTSTTSLSKFPRKLSKITDNRVTLLATATGYMTNVLNEWSDEKQNTTMEIFDSTYDITTINVGDTVGPGGFGNFIDNLVLQIVAKNVKKHSVVVMIGKLPIRASQQLDEVTRSTDDLYTIDNPANPT